MRDDFIITTRDLEAKGFCILGQRRWAIVNGWDFANFLKNGIKASELEKTQDGMALRAVELMRNERG